MLFAHTSEPPPRASRRRPELPQALDEIFERALSKDPAERPDSAAALVDEICGDARTRRAGGPWARRRPRGPPRWRSGPWSRSRWPPPPAAQRPSPAKAGGMAGRGRARGRGARGRADRRDRRRRRRRGEGRSGDTRRSTGARKRPGRAGAGARLPRAAARERGSPGCTIVQSALPGRALVVPEDGVIRRWSVRSARGELALSVVRPRGDETFQVARSRNEFVGNGGVHLFDADLAVERGDVVGLAVLPGSAAGVRPGVDGAKATRWTPYVNAGKRRGAGVRARAPPARGVRARWPAADPRPGDRGGRGGAGAPVGWSSGADFASRAGGRPRSPSSRWATGSCWTSSWTAGAPRVSTCPPISVRARARSSPSRHTRTLLCRERIESRDRVRGDRQRANAEALLRRIPA